MSVPAPATEPQPVAPSVPAIVSSPSLSGACACCGAETKSLFAMGHDARFRGVLARALATDGWDAPAVVWHSRGAGYAGASAGTLEQLSVREALARVDALIGRDWTAKVEASAARSSGQVRKAPPVGASEPRVPLRDFTSERIDELCDRLAGHPLTGQWGWWRPKVLVGGLSGGSCRTPARFPARVQATRRDSGDSRIDLFCPEAWKAGVIPAMVVESVEPAEWLRDEGARSA